MTNRRILVNVAHSGSGKAKTGGPKSAISMGGKPRPGRVGSGRAGPGRVGSENSADQTTEPLRGNKQKSCNFQIRLQHSFAMELLLVALGGGGSYDGGAAVDGGR